jgi:hypothetical protein
MRDYLEFRRYCETCLYGIFWENRVLVVLTPNQVRRDFRSAVSDIETALGVYACFG